MRHLKTYRYWIIILVILLAGGGYYYYTKYYTNQSLVSYETEAVTKGSISTTVSGSGQVLSSSQVDVKPKTQGELTAVNIVQGQHVKTGDVLAQIDATDLQKSVKDAKNNVELAQIELEKLNTSATDLDIAKAEHAVTNAKIALEDVKKKATDTAITKARNDLAKAENDLANLKITQSTSLSDAKTRQKTAEDNLSNSYEDIYSTISEAYLDFPETLQQLDDILFSHEIADSEVVISNNMQNKDSLLDMITGTQNKYDFEQLIIKAEKSYNLAKSDYDKYYDKYTQSSRSSDNQTKLDLLNDAVNLSKEISDTVSNQKNMLDKWVEYRQDRDEDIYKQIETYRTDLKTLTTNTNSHVSKLNSVKTNIDDKQSSIDQIKTEIDNMGKSQPLSIQQSELSVKEKKEALDDLLSGADPNDIIKAENTLKEAELSLTKTKSGADALDIKTKQISLKQKQDALATAEKNLADASVKSPIDGIVATTTIKKGDTVTSTTTIATIISENKLVELVLNEADTPKVKADQQATITFDAIEGLSIVGKVVSIDEIGTVSSGVVTYKSTIALTKNDERVKTSMSASGIILIEVKTDILLVPNSAIEYNNNVYEVKILNDGETAPMTQEVEVGISDDTSYEITGGLKEGDKVVTKTINQTTVTTSSGNSLFGGLLGGNRNSNRSSSSSSSSTTKSTSGGGGDMMGPPPGAF